MVVVFDAVRRFGRGHPDLDRYRAEYFREWPRFARQARSSACAIVVLDDEEPGDGGGVGDESDAGSGMNPLCEGWPHESTTMSVARRADAGGRFVDDRERTLGNAARGSPRKAGSREPGDAVMRDGQNGTGGVRARLRTLVREVGPVPLVVVSANAFARSILLGRLPVDAVLTGGAVTELGPTVARLLAGSARHRLAQAVETVDLALPRPLAIAFAHALRGIKPPGTCRSLAALAGLSATALRAALRASPHGRAGRKLYWFVDAARIVHASEPASRGLDQLASAVTIGTSERTLTRSRQRVLGPDSEWRDLRNPGATARRVWTDLIAVSTGSDV